MQDKRGGERAGLRKGGAERRRERGVQNGGWKKECRKDDGKLVGFRIEDGKKCKKEDGK
jgi:hypothetical protein